MIRFGFFTVHSEKKGYQNGATGVLLLQMVPFFQSTDLYSIISCTPGTLGHRISTPKGTNYGQSNSAPRGTVSVPFFF